MRRRLLSLRFGSLALVALGAVAACRREPSLTLRVAVAADLAPAFEALGAEFTHNESVGVAYTFASSESLSQQMQEGASARFDVLVTPDTSQVGRLVSLRRCEDLSRTFAGFATLVMVTAPGAPRADAVQSLSDLRYGRIAVMNPDASPFGRAAMQVLNSLGLYQTVASRLVFTDTARQSLEMLRANTAQAAIVPRVAVTAGDSLAIPSDLYRPVEQVGVMCARDPARREASTRFLQYLHEGEGKALLEAYGYAFP
jgi:molybdate transport system substrate-binding protein